MKKLICILLVCIIPVIAYAAVELSSMSYNDLLSLQKQIVAEIMSRPEWKEVTVPAGSWRVGEDIPAGTYSMRSDFAGVTVWRREIDDYADNGLYYNEIIQRSGPCGKIILESGMLVELSAEVVFAPPLSLGF